jgi:hypothetical protein
LTSLPLLRRETDSDLRVRDVDKMRSTPMRHPCFVPVRTSQAGTLALRTGRLLSGERVGLAFTSEASLLLTLGPSQQWIRLDADALLYMLQPLGVKHVRVDPRPATELMPGTLPKERVIGDIRPEAGQPVGA